MIINTLSAILFQSSAADSYRTATELAHSRGDWVNITTALKAV